MKNVFLFILLVSGISYKSNAQYYYFYNNKYYDKDLITELGPSLGGMNCFTDLGKHSPFFKTLTFSRGFYAEIMYKDVFGLRLETTWGRAEAADSLSKTSTRLRNLNFRSSIQEFALIAEFHPLMLTYYPDGPPRLSPYVMVGVGRFSFNPQTQYLGTWIDLQPLRTEGEGFAEYPDHKPYHLSQFNIPVGAGLKYELSELFTIRGELIYRFLFTDYLDDVSTTYIDPTLFDKYLSPTDAVYAKALYSREGEIKPGAVPSPGDIRGHVKHADAYYTFNIKLGINLGRMRKY